MTASRVRHRLLIEHLGDEHATGFEVRDYRVHDTEGIEPWPHRDDVPWSVIEHVHSIQRDRRDDLMVCFVDTELLWLSKVKVIEMVPRSLADKANDDTEEGAC